jgi:hypothetical protein
LLIAMGALIAAVVGRAALLDPQTTASAAAAKVASNCRSRSLPGGVGTDLASRVTIKAPTLALLGQPLKQVPLLRAEQRARAPMAARSRRRSRCSSPG